MLAHCNSPRDVYAGCHCLLEMIFDFKFITEITVIDQYTNLI